MQIIPRQLCDNAGFDATDVLNKLRQKHASGQPISLFLNCWIIREIGIFLFNGFFYQAEERTSEWI